MKVKVKITTIFLLTVLIILLNISVVRAETDSLSCHCLKIETQKQGEDTLIMYRAGISNEIPIPEGTGMTSRFAMSPVDNLNANYKYCDKKSMDSCNKREQCLRQYVNFDEINKESSSIEEAANIKHQKIEEAKNKCKSFQVDNSGNEEKDSFSSEEGEEESTKLEQKCFEHCTSNGKCKYFLSVEKDAASKKGYRIVDDSYCETVRNYDTDNLVSCGNKLLSDIPRIVPKSIHLVYLILEIVVPLLLIVFGSIDFVKAVIAQKEDEIKKGQQTFIKRIIAGIIIFFVFSIVKLIISIAADKDKSKNIIDCADCLINNNEKCEVG